MISRILKLFNKGSYATDSCNSCTVLDDNLLRILRYGFVGLQFMSSFF